VHQSIILKFFLSCILISTVLGCASSHPNTKSGYLEDYSQLQQSNEYEDTKIYIAPSFDKALLGPSRKLKIEAFEVWLDQQDKLPLNLNQLAEISRYFQNQFELKLSPTYQVMDVADEETLTIRGAFTGIKLSAPRMSVTDFIPIRLVINAGKAVYLTATNQSDIISEVSIEAEFILGQNPKPVLTITSFKTLESTVSSDNEGNIEAMKKVLDIWVNNFVAALNKIKQ
jgi:hypothetical protein